MRLAVIVPRSRGARRVFEYLRSGARAHDTEVHLLRPELARVTRLDEFDVVVAGDHALAAQMPRLADVVVVHDLGPHRSPHLFRGLYAPSGVKRRRLEEELGRADVITFSSTTARLLDEVCGAGAEVVKPGVDVRYWTKYGDKERYPMADVGAIVPSTDPVTKGLPFVAEAKNRGLSTLIVTGKFSEDDWTHVHLARAADVVVFEPTDVELAKLRTKAWVAPGFEGFGLAPLEMHVATGAVPVWTYDEGLGPDETKPREFQVPRSPEGVRELKALIQKRPEFPVSDYRDDRFAERFLEVI